MTNDSWYQLHRPFSTSRMYACRKCGRTVEIPLSEQNWSVGVRPDPCGCDDD